MTKDGFAAWLLHHPGNKLLLAAFIILWFVFDLLTGVAILYNLLITGVIGLFVWLIIYGFEKADKDTRFRDSESKQKAKELIDAFFLATWNVTEPYDLYKLGSNWAARLFHREAVVVEDKVFIRPVFE